MRSLTGAGPCPCSLRRSQRRARTRRAVERQPGARRAQGGASGLSLEAGPRRFVCRERAVRRNSTALRADFARSANGATSARRRHRRAVGPPGAQLGHVAVGGAVEVGARSGCPRSARTLGGLEAAARVAVARTDRHLAPPIAPGARRVRSGPPARAVIHLDTNFLISALQGQSPEAAWMDSAVARSLRVSISAMAWSEFLCGPLPPGLEAARPPVSGRPPDGRGAAEIRLAATRARSAQGASKLPRLATTDIRHFARFIPAGLVIACSLP